MGHMGSSPGWHQKEEGALELESKIYLICQLAPFYYLYACSVVE